LEILRHFLHFISDFWDIALWTGAWYAFPVWMLIELVISTLIIFIKHKKSKEDFPDNWEKGYFKRLGSIGLLLLFLRTFITIFIMYIISSTSIRLWLISLVNFLLISALLASSVTIWILVKFQSILSSRAKAYLALLSIPIAFFYSVVLFIALF